MIKVDVSLSIGFATANHEDELEFDDNATDEQIDAEVQEWAWNYIDIGWSKHEIGTRRRRNR